MALGDDAFRRLQAAARSTAARTGTAAPTQEYLTRHLLESFLDRLTRTQHAKNFVLKGGILLAAYGVRRPTMDADANAISADVTTDHLTDVVRDIATVDTAAGVVFDLDTITVQQIREHAGYPGHRVRITAAIGPWHGIAAWDVSTGDPTIPEPRTASRSRPSPVCCWVESQAACGHGKVGDDGGMIGVERRVGHVWGRPLDRPGIVGRQRPAGVDVVDAIGRRVVLKWAPGGAGALRHIGVDRAIDVLEPSIRDRSADRPGQGQAVVAWDRGPRVRPVQVGQGIEVSGEDDRSIIGRGVDMAQHLTDLR